MVRLTAILVQLAASAVVYRYTDKQGQDHFVNHKEMVPEGVSAQAVDLGDVSLNPETERALEQLPEQEREKAEAEAREARAKLGERSKAAAPDWAQPALIGAALLTLGFLVLTFLHAYHANQSKALAASLALARMAVGSLALLSWIAVAFEMRDRLPGLEPYFPPLKAMNQAHDAVDKANARERDREHQIDQMFRNK